MIRSDARRPVVLALAFALVAGTGLTPGVLVGEPPSTVAAQDVTPLDQCTTIDEPGTYVLTADIENGGKTRISGTCIEITANGVTLDGNGHTIDGRGVSHTKGVIVASAEGVVVRNVTVKEWHEGLFVTDGSATVRDVTAHSNAYGIRLESADGSRVANSTVEDNLVGIYVAGADVTLDENDVADNDVDVKRTAGSSARGPPASGRALAT